MINRKKANAVVVVLGLGVMTVAMIACKDEPPAVAPQPAYTGYAPSATAYPSGVPAATAPAAGGQMATPGPLALPCQADSACGYAHCNVTAGKCAFPCVNSALDCIQGSTCNTMTGFCFPGGGQ